jgi:hypothetical protein
MQVYVGLDLGIDTEDNDTLTMDTHDSERSRPKTSDNEVLDFRLDSDERILGQHSHAG